MMDTLTRSLMRDQVRAMRRSGFAEQVARFMLYGDKRGDLEGGLNVGLGGVYIGMGGNVVCVGFIDT